MLGFKDFWVLLGFLLMILSAILCVIYGLINWNHGVEIKSIKLEKEKRWAKEEAKIEKVL